MPAHDESYGCALARADADQATVRLAPEHAAVLLDGYRAGRYRSTVDEFERTLAGEDLGEDALDLDHVRAELVADEQVVETLAAIASGREPESVTMDEHGLRLLLSGRSEDVSDRLQTAFENGDVGDARRLLGEFKLLVDIMEQLAQEEDGG